MFGIGGGELVVILIVTLLAVGPDRMPTLLKAVGRGIREMRKATRELQSTVGLDELLQDDTFRDPLGLKSAPKKPEPTSMPVAKPEARPPEERRAPRRGAHVLGDAALARESPEDGVDVDYAEARLERARRLESAAASKPSEEPVS